MKKWIPNIFRIDELELLEEYLQNQAAQGWILEKVGLRGFIFKKAESQNLRYCVDIPSAHRKRGGTNEYLQSYYEMCEEAGWTLVGTDTTIHVFMTDDLTVPPIHTDPNIRFEAAESYFRDQSGGAGLLLVIMVLLAIPLIPGLLAIGNGKALFFAVVLLFGMILMGNSMYAGYQWKKAREQALITGDWKAPKKRNDRIYLRTILEGIFYVAVIVVDVILIKDLWLTEVNSIYDALSLFLKPPLFGVLLGIGAYGGIRFFYKRGLDASTARILGIAIALGLFAAWMGGIKLLEADKIFKESSTTVSVQWGKIKEAPLTAEMLGITNARKGTYWRERGKEVTSLEYVQYLENKGCLSYHYSLCKDEASAAWIWESQYGADQYTVEYDSIYYTSEWVDTDLSVLDTDNAKVMKYRSSDGKTTEYRYIIQRGNVYIRLVYTEGILTKEQLQVISGILPESQ